MVQCGWSAPLLYISPRENFCSIVYIQSVALPRWPRAYKAGCVSSDGWGSVHVRGLMSSARGMLINYVITRVAAMRYGTALTQEIT